MLRHKNSGKLVDVRNFSLFFFLFICVSIGNETVYTSNLIRAKEFPFSNKPET